MSVRAGVTLPLSVAIVCRDNEATIGRTLESVAPLAGEIVALDSGSTDGTIALLERFGARVERVQWAGHVRTKQMALDLCAQKWVLCIDSDESVEPALAAAIREAIARDEAGVGGYEVNRKVFWRGRFLEHAWQPEWRLRLVRRGEAAWGGHDPHDELRLAPAARARGLRVARLEGTLRHDAFTTMAQFLARQVEHSRVAAASLRAAGVRGSRIRIATSPVGAFTKQMVLKQAWRDGWRGWCAAGAVAAAALMKHVMLVEGEGEGEGEGDERVSE